MDLNFLLFTLSLILFFFNKAILANGINYILGELNANTTIAISSKTQQTITTPYIGYLISFKKNLLPLTSNFSWTLRLTRKHTHLRHASHQVLSKTLMTPLLLLLQPSPITKAVLARFGRILLKKIKMERVNTTSGNGHKRSLLQLFSFCVDSHFWARLRVITKQVEDNFVLQWLAARKTRVMLSRRRSDPKWYTGDVHTASVEESNQAEVDACLKRAIRRSFASSHQKHALECQ